MKLSEVNLHVVIVISFIIIPIQKIHEIIFDLTSVF